MNYQMAGPITVGMKYFLPWSIEQRTNLQDTHTQNTLVDIDTGILSVRVSMTISMRMRIRVI